MVRIGYALSSEEHRPGELVRHGRLAEEAGFSFALISDHFHPWIDAQAQALIPVCESHRSGATHHYDRSHLRGRTQTRMTSAHGTPCARRSHRTEAAQAGYVLISWCGASSGLDGC